MAAIELYSTPLFSDSALENYYRLDDTADSSSHSRTLNDPGGATPGQASGGKFGDWAYSNEWRPGDNLYADTFSVGTNDITFGCWVLKSAAPTNDFSPTMMHIGTSDRLFLVAGKNTGYANFFTYGAGNYTNATNTTNINVCDGVWHLVIGVRVGTSVKLYVDGSLVGSGTGTARSPNANTVVLGAGNDATYDHLTEAGIDDAFVFSRGLSATEVSNLYNGTWSSIKKINGVAYASIKKVSGVAIASVKKISGLA